MSSYSRQQGFTLIEIAIVLVIIGLLLGGVLKGQELIENGKIKNVVNDLNGVTAAVNAYRDRYRALPGDDAGATNRGWPGAPANGNGDGFVGGATANPFDPAQAENLNFWRHLRAAGLTTGDPATTGAPAIPQHAGGGLMGVSRAVQGIPGNAVCLGNLSGKYALAIDAQMDDGNRSTGSIRALNTAAGTNTAPVVGAPVAAAYNETLSYTLCKVL